MATSAIAGSGFTIKIGDGGTPTETFTAIAEVFEAGDFISPQQLFEDVSHFGTPLGGKDEIGVGTDNKQFEFKVNYLPGDSTHDHVNGLIRDMLDATLRNFRILLPGPDNLGIAMSARVQDVSSETLTRRGVLRATVTLNPQTWSMESSVGW